MDKEGFKHMGRRLFIWLIINLESKYIVNVHLTVNSRATYDVIHMVKRLGLGVEYVHDGGPWYRALDWMGVEA